MQACLLSVEWLPQTQLRVRSKQSQMEGQRELHIFVSHIFRSDWDEQRRGRGCSSKQEQAQRRCCCAAPAVGLHALHVRGGLWR